MASLMNMQLNDDMCLQPGPCLNASKAMRANPLMIFERLSIAEHYEFERVGENELHISLGGLWCDHDVSLVWNREQEHIGLFLMLDGRSPGGRSDDMCRLLSLLNERQHSGHFDFWDKDSALVFRNSLLLSGGARLKVEQAMALLASALDAAERGYPACQYVAWAGKTPEEAIDTALLDIAAHQ